MSESEVRNVIEAALFAAGKCLTINELSLLFDELDRPTSDAIRAQLEALEAEFANRSIEIKETAAGFRVQVRREYSPMVARLWPERPQRYSRALLETLALIAYRQPITRAEIESVRGVTVNPNITKTLLERQWIRVVGHRDLPGRPELLGTTREFLEYFGLRSLDELPPLTQLRSLEALDPQLELTDPLDAGSVAVVARVSVPSADAELEDESGETDSADADEVSAAPSTGSGLVAAPPDDSH
jgi:segregation and condensation protein B